MRPKLVPATLVLGLAAAACGGSSQGQFGWLHPRAAPQTWAVAQVPSGAQLPYPPGWRTIHGDRGTATAALLDGQGGFLGYLNLTPRQGAETLAGWASFRVAHNGDEGDRKVKRLAAATGLQFLTGRGSCVKDSYTTKTGTHYIELACLVAGSKTSSVIVGAAPPARWARESGAIERAISAFRT